jgi:uncharacterized membrane protein
MSKKGINKKKERIAEKKAVVLGTAKKSRVPLIIAVVSLVIAAGAVTFYFSRAGDNPTAVASVPTAADNTFVAFPASLFEDGKARHFEYVNGKHTIRYFILKSSDGIIRAAFDACDVCWPAGKGYYQDGDYMVCRNCGRRFASVLVNEVRGGCNPAPLNRTFENGKLVIQIEDILNGREYFNPEGNA